MQAGMQFAPVMVEEAQKTLQSRFMPPDTHGLGGRVCVTETGTKGLLAVATPATEPFEVAVVGASCLFSKRSWSDLFEICGKVGMKAGFDP
jgi:hypothetical protein